MTLHERWLAQLAELRARGRHRRLASSRGIDFSSNDYLGFGQQPLPPVDAPTSGGASRLLSGQNRLWDRVEDMLAEWHGAEAALVMTSGCVANEGLLATILEPGDWVASDHANHFSLITGMRLGRAERFIYRHNDLNHLEEGLRLAVRGAGTSQQRFVVCESLYGMAADRAPLAHLTSLCQHYGAYLIVDEAHATGCFGGAGGGLVDVLGLRGQVLATVHTGGKALGVAGAYVCGSTTLKDLLVNRSGHLLFTTALPPAVAEWWLRAIPRVQAASAERTSLHGNAQLFRRELERQNIAAPGTDYIVPILLGADDKAVSTARALQAKGWDIRAIRPPTVPDGSARLRISIHADHTPDMLRELAKALKEAM